MALGFLAAAALGGYLLASGGHGFPLDDAWIHQTYARNLAQRGEWAFVPGQPSGGATSVLWVLLLTPSAWLGPEVWAGLLGWLALWGLGLLGAAAFARLRPAQAAWAPWVGALLILEFHLVWAAGSGMETALFALLCLAALWLSLHTPLPGFAAGLLVGLAVLVRPEGLTLLGPLGLAAVRRSRPGGTLAGLAAGLCVLLVPYLLFNHSVAGTWWPNTLYAKQAEYAALLAQPLGARWAAQLAQPLIGAGLVLLPGLLVGGLRAWRQRHWLELSWGAWLLGFALLFALRLPVTYQHGRYAMPLIPILLVLAAAGALAASAQLRSAHWRRRLGFAWSSLLALCTLAFYILGARAYGRDVAFIQNNMVAAAEWLAANTPASARLAAHDIGALGYFAPRPLLDLAGLVSPEVVPFLRDEARLAQYLDAQRAEYVILFPDWYPQLSQRAAPVWRAPAGEMVILRWPAGE
ncbi:MAG: hypothetical protein KIT29_00675 [Anaerolineales bacterium]|nr:hypothetical protein [Anaerolineales bacterium]